MTAARRVAVDPYAVMHIRKQLHQKLAKGQARLAKQVCALDEP